MDDGAALLGAEALEQALAHAYRYLGHRERTVAEVRRHLKRRRFAPATIESAVAELRGQGYLDDSRFARRFAEDRRTLDGWGAGRIRERLLALGIDAELADRAAGARDGEQELCAAVEVLRRRMGAPSDDDRGRARALAILARRGYELELAYDAIRRFGAGDEDAP